MKHLKILGLLAVAAAAMMAFAATASATTITAPANTLYTSTISATNSGSLTLHGPADVTCNKSTVTGKVEKHGAGVTAEGKVSTLSFTECNQHVKVNSGGTLIVHGLSGNKGTLTSTGASVSVEFTTIFGNINCTYGTNATHIGTVTGAASSTGHATLAIDSAPIPVTAGGGLCGSSAEWTGAYKVNTPTGLTIDQ